MLKISKLATNCLSLVWYNTRKEWLHSLRSSTLLNSCRLQSRQSHRPPPRSPLLTGHTNQFDTLSTGDSLCNCVEVKHFLRIYSFDIEESRLRMLGLSWSPPLVPGLTTPHLALSSSSPSPGTPCSTCWPRSGSTPSEWWRRIRGRRPRDRHEVILPHHSNASFLFLIYRVSQKKVSYEKCSF